MFDTNSFYFPSLLFILMSMANVGQTSDTIVPVPVPKSTVGPVNQNVLIRKQITSVDVKTGTRR